MEEQAYRDALSKVLNQHAEQVSSKLLQCLELVPEKAQELELMIFPDQDGEGTFSIRVSLSGPDLYVLNKALGDAAKLLKVGYNTPNAPLLDPSDIDEDEEFYVNDVLADVVGKWLSDLWKKLELKDNNLPVYVTADEGYGALLPIRLN